VALRATQRAPRSPRDAGDNEARSRGDPAAPSSSIHESYSIYFGISIYLSPRFDILHHVNDATHILGRQRIVQVAVHPMDRALAAPVGAKPPRPSARPPAAGVLQLPNGRCGTCRCSWSPAS